LCIKLLKVFLNTIFEEYNSTSSAVILMIPQISLKNALIRNPAVENTQIESIIIPENIHNDTLNHPNHFILTHSSISAIVINTKNKKITTKNDPNEIYM